jgi:RNA polymerase sigma-70 factor (sigma-E family)
MRSDSRAEQDAAFTRFVTANAGRLQRIAELITGDPHQAADLTQTALERAYRHWSSIESEDPVGYVRRIIVNQYRNWWRLRRGREQSVEYLPEVLSPHDFTDRHAQLSVVLRALNTLTHKERQVVVLRFYAELSGLEIAAELGVAHGTVKSTLSRALGKLRAFPELTMAAERTVETTT